MDRISLDSIAVRPGRRRLSPETVQSLAASISEIGLLNAITITSDGVLVAGLHRLEAVRSLGWPDVPATVITVDEVARELAEIDENLCRSDLTELERAQHLKRRKELYLAAHPETGTGKAPGKAGGGKVAKTDKLSTFAADAAEKVGASDRDVRRAVRRAERIAPDVQDAVAALPAIADSGVELDALARMEPAQQREVVAAVKAGTARDVRQAATRGRRAARVQEIVERSTASDGPAAATRFPVILADPPWRYEHVPQTESRAVENQYPTMSLDEICALEVPAAEDAILYLWVTSPKLEEALRVVACWGFSYRTCMVWVKDRIGMGYYARQQHELLLIATRGNIPPPEESARPASVISAPRKAHSAKPLEVYELIERAYPTLPKIELFARTVRQGWDRWGFEA